MKQVEHTSGTYCPGCTQRQIDVYWQGDPGLGFLECETDGRIARWANGKWNRITFCHSEGHYVWVRK